MSTRSRELRDLAQALRGGSPPVVVVDQALRIPSPEGDPQALLDAAADFRKSAQALEGVSTDLEKLRRNRLPQVWPRGEDARAAEQRIQATERHSGHSSQVLADISGCLTDLAGGLSGAQDTDRVAREQIHNTVPMAQAASPDQLDGVIATFAGHIDAMAGAAEVAENAGAEAARLLNEYAAAATAGQLDTLSLTATERLLLASAADDVGPILSSSDAERAAAALEAMSPEERREFNELLDAAGSDLERAWLLKALAAGNDLAAVTAFGNEIRGQDQDWLQETLRPLDPDRVDGERRLTWQGAALEQSTSTTCGSMSLLLNRAMHDPVYAFDLATGDGSMADRLAAEEEQIHSDTNRLRFEDWRIKWWPSQLGTAPGHAADWLSDHTGTDYRVGWDVNNSGDGTRANVADTVTGASAGDPSLLLIGDGYPDHYVMVVGQDDDGILVYNPAWGRVESIPAENLHNEPLTELNRDKLYAVITPTS
jgi:hypothetical protein